MNVGMILKRFERPDECREMTLGRFEVVKLGGMTIGRATYQPGWKWSVHVGPTVGAPLCTVEHVGLVIAGAATAAFEDGTVIEMGAGISSTFRRGRTIVGSLATNCTFRFIFWGPNTTRGDDPMIRKLKSGKYRLYSRKKNPRTGKRRNLGTFGTRAAAQKHERAVQFFKRQG